MWCLMEARPRRYLFVRGCIAFLAVVIASSSLSAAKDDSKEKDKKEKKDKDKVEEITFDDVKLDLQKDEPFDPKKLTDRAKELDDQMIRVRGWILPSSVFQQKGIKSFVLVRDNMECCFGPGAALFDCMIVEMESDKATDFTTKPIAVEGRFSLKEFKYPDGKHYAIYHLRGRSVK